MERNGVEDRRHRDTYAPIVRARRRPFFFSIALLKNADFSNSGVDEAISRPHAAKRREFYFPEKQLWR